MRTLITLIAAACLVGAAFAQQPNQPPKPGPELQRLQDYFGEWTYEGETQATPLGPGGRITGRMTGRPVVNGFAEFTPSLRSGQAREDSEGLRAPNAILTILPDISLAVARIPAFAGTSWPLRKQGLASIRPHVIVIQVMPQPTISLTT